MRAAHREIYERGADRACAHSACETMERCFVTERSSKKNIYIIYRYKSERSNNAYARERAELYLYCKGASKYICVVYKRATFAFDNMYIYITPVRPKIRV